MRYNTKYTRNDLENIIALCEQCKNNKQANSLSNRCKRALTYTNVSIRLTKNDKQFLKTQYDEEMDEDALLTLKRLVENVDII